MIFVEMEEVNEVVYGVVEVKFFNVWRLDVVGIFFFLFFVMWGVVVVVFLKNGNICLW